MFLSIFILPFVLCSVRPLLNSFAMLLVLDPLSDVRGPVRVLVGPMTVGFVVAPGTLVNIAICVDQDTVTICLIRTPLAVVLASVLPDLLPITVFHSLEELSGVDGTIAESNGSVVLPHIIVHHFTGYSRDRSYRRT